MRRRDLDPNPFRQFDLWMQAALQAVPIEPTAMTLATATSEGIPSARMVLLKGFDERGFVFFTNYDSQKGREMAENPRAALVFWWAELHRQVRIAGVIGRVAREESEIYFRSRPRASQLSAWTSRQSQAIERREVLEARQGELAAQYEGQEIPCPPYWGGYRLAPDVIEFWQGQLDRLHDRLRYTRQADGGWVIERLAP